MSQNGKIGWTRKESRMRKEIVTRKRKLRKETFSPVGHPNASFLSPVVDNIRCIKRSRIGKPQGFIIRIKVGK